MTSIDALVEKVTPTLAAHGIGPHGGSPHAWRCEYPDRYGPCDCVHELAEAMVRATLAALGPAPLHLAASILHVLADDDPPVRILANQVQGVAERIEP